jgi:hypothetical protein
MSSSPDSEPKIAANEAAIPVGETTYENVDFIQEDVQSRISKLLVRDLHLYY